MWGLLISYAMGSRLVRFRFLVHSNFDGTLTHRGDYSPRSQVDSVLLRHLRAGPVMAPGDSTLFS